MGKAAENERTKLRATFYNNLSVGLVLAGVLIPYLGFIQSDSLELDAVSNVVMAGHVPVLTHLQGLKVLAFGVLQRSGLSLLGQHSNNENPRLSLLT
jgi:hypothetical protein